MTITKKWLFTFYTPASKGALLKEVVYATDWKYASIIMKSKYTGIKITHYTQIK